jgi:hypothetical protein
MGKFNYSTPHDFKTAVSCLGQRQVQLQHSTWASKLHRGEDNRTALFPSAGGPVSQVKKNAKQ